MLLYSFLFFAFLSICVVNRDQKLDPSLIVLPCSLLVSFEQTTLITVYISLIPALFLLALFQVVKGREDLHIEQISRYGAGLLLGAFAGVQLLILLMPSFYYLLGTLFLFLLLNLYLNVVDSAFWEQQLGYTKLLKGFLVAMIQFASLSTGLTLFSKEAGRSARVNRSALWLMALIGAFVGYLALPVSADLPYFSWQMSVIFIVTACVAEWLVSRTSVSAYESKVLNWIVMIMSLSIWVHLLIKHLFYS